MKKVKHRRTIFIGLLPILVSCLASIYLRVVTIANYNIAFGPDQARDMLEIRNIVIGHHLTLIGPVTDIIGLFLGPFWYYFNLIPFLISGGNPLSFVYWLIGWFLVAVIILYRYLKERNLTLAIVSSFLLLLSPLTLSLTRWAFNPHAVPIMMIFFIVILLIHIEESRLRWAVLLGVVCGIVLQLQAAFGFVLLPYLLIVYFLRRESFKIFRASIVGFGITLLPQLVFEISHRFIMTRSLLTEFSGRSSYLGKT